MGCILCGGDLSVFFDNLKGNISAYPGNVYPFRVMKCQSCELLQKEVTTSYVDFLQDVYQHHYNFFSDGQNNLDDGEVARGKAVIEAICHLREDDKIKWLDYGSGGGHFLRLLSQEKPQWELYAYDVSHLNCDKFGDISLHNQVFTVLDDIKERFDVISLNMVLEHLSDPISILTALREKLSDGGCLVIRIPNFKNLPTDFFIYEHIAHYHKQAILFLLEKSGFVFERNICGIPDIEYAFIARKIHPIDYNNNLKIPRSRGGGAFVGSKK